MGGAPSKKIEEALETSSAFKGAVDASYEECMTLTQHKYAGLLAYQLLDASGRVYEKLEGTDDEDTISTFKEKFLPNPPTQMDVDKTITKEELFEGGKQVVSLEEFRIFCTTLFKDMGLTTACQKLVVYVPASSLGVLLTHLVIKRLPFVGPPYRAAGPLMPVVLFGSMIGVIISQLNPT